VTIGSHLTRLVGLSIAVLAIAAVVPNPLHAAPGASVWWTGGDQTLRSAPLLGGAATDVFAEFGAQGSTVDFAAGRVYGIVYTPSVNVGDLAGTSATPLMAVAPSDMNGLTIDPTRGRGYWGDFAGSGAIRYFSLDGTSSGTLYSNALTGLARPVSPVADPAANRIYWVNRGDGKIAYAKLDGTSTAAVTISPTGCSSISELYSLAVDVEGDVAYVGSYEEVFRVDLTSGACEAVATSLGGLVFGIALDRATSRLYFADWGGTAGIYSVKTDGTGLATVVETSQPAFPWIVKPPTAAVTVSASGTGLGSTLTCDVSWNVDDPAANLFQSAQSTSAAWYRDGSPIAGETGRTLRADTAGAYLCRAVGANQAGVTSTDSVVKTIDPAPSAAADNAPAKVARLRARVACRGLLCVVTGRMPAGATRIDLVAGRSRLTRGQGHISKRCVIRSGQSQRGFACTMRLRAGTWRLVATARAGSRPVAVWTGRVRVAPIVPANPSSVTG